MFAEIMFVNLKIITNVIQAVEVNRHLFFNSALR
jgi:hypothetical protein